jgi:hypothetical protein
VKGELMAETECRDHKCFEKARARGERTFTLVAQDYSSPAVILEWIKQNLHVTPEAKLRDAFEDAMTMLKHPRRKNPD